MNIPYQEKSWKEIWESYSLDNRKVLLAAFGFSEEEIEYLVNASWEGIDQCMRNGTQRNFITNEADSMFEQDIENSYEEEEGDER